MARTHLVWDWNGTLLDDLSLVVDATIQAFAAVGGRSLDSDEHRRTFRRPVAEFYAEILERAVDAEEFGRLDRIYHDAYRLGLTTTSLAAEASHARDDRTAGAGVGSPPVRGAQPSTEGERSSRDGQRRRRPRRPHQQDEANDLERDHTQRETATL